MDATTTPTGVAPVSVRQEGLAWAFAGVLMFSFSVPLTKDWFSRIIKTVGNYGESYERNVGAGSKLQIARGLNQLWNKGGIQYAPPIR